MRKVVVIINNQNLTSKSFLSWAMKVQLQLIYCYCVWDSGKYWRSLWMRMDRINPVKWLGRTRRWVQSGRRSLPVNGWIMWPVFSFSCLAAPAALNWILQQHITLIFHFISAGFVHLNPSSSPVCHHNQLVLSCAGQDFHTKPVWQLSRDDQVFNITNGTESEVTFHKLRSTVRIRSVSKIWTGVWV